jgi:16S rRNA (cytosine967-C5)-methyltransferase
MPVSPARAAAFEILQRIEKTESYASELLHSQRFAKLSPADHGLLTELVMGVLRWRSLLDDQIGKYSTKSLTKLDLEVLTALRLGAYQLLFLDRIPTHATVHDSVELVKQARKRSAAGMANAVLRKIAKSDSEFAHLSKNKREVEHFSRKPQLIAHPKWLVNKWIEYYGADATGALCADDQIAPKTTIRLNNSALVEELQAEGVTVRPGCLLANAFIVETGNISQTKLFRERRLIIQDEASQLVALLIGRGNSVLDCCSAPGGKTRIIAEQNPHSIVVAMELHFHRAALLTKLAPAGNIRVIAADARQIPLSMKFDRVLVDAPCSGTGTLARNPEIKWRLKAEDLPRLQKYQTAILLTAMSHVTSGGRLIYSTCSLEPEENSAVIDEVLATNSSFRVLDCRPELQRLSGDGELAIEDIDSLVSGSYLRTIPGIHPCDGFFAAILEKI